MAFWKPIGKDIRSLDNFGLSTTQNSQNRSLKEEFYELEVGIVLDIILDDTHPIFSSKTTIDSDRWPENVEGQSSNRNEKDLSWIGRALIRPIVSGKLINKDDLPWVFPLESNISEYPLLNELVVLVKHGNKLFYSRKINFKNWPHNSLDFGAEISNSGTENVELFSNPPIPYAGPISKTKFRGGINYQGVAGRYFVANNKIRTVRRFEGDLLFESRFGQSIHFTAYDKNRENDVGAYPNYINGGNPMIIIRNRQRQLLKPGQTLELNHSPNAAKIRATDQEKNVGGYLDEDINHDGSSIYITSGKTISNWVTTCYKKMFGNGEEVKKFNGNTKFKYPILDGDQIIIQTDRLILSSRYGESFHYSKKRYSIVSDDELTVDAHNQIVMTTNTKTVINSPAIYLGEYDNTNEPVLLGQTTVNWMYELCNWLIDHTHWYKHSHVDAGQESPSQTQFSVQVQNLILLRDKLKSLLSKRVFVTGGGFAPGSNGEKIENGSDPTNINLNNGNGLPGGWKGQNYRKS